MTYTPPSYYRKRDALNAKNLRALLALSGQPDSFTIAATKYSKRAGADARYICLRAADGCLRRLAHRTLRALRDHGYVEHTQSGIRTAGTWRVTESGRELLERVPE